MLEKLGSEHTPEQMRELGKDVARARRNSRFLPHPAMADRLPGEDMLRPGPGFVDRARSALSQPG